MRLNVAACTAALVVGSGIMASGAMVTTSADLDFVVGQGANLSVLVIDFNAGPDSSFAWGFRYDGTATGQDLLAAISTADSNLTIDSTSFVQEVNYFDGTTNFFQTSDFGAGGVSFGYYLAGGEANTFDPVTFAPSGSVPIPGGGVTVTVPTGTEYTLSPSGTAGRTLANGSFDALSFGSFEPTSFAHLTPPGPELPLAAAFTAVPEPSVTGLLASLLVVCGLRRKR